MPERDKPHTHAIIWRARKEPTEAEWDKIYRKYSYRMHDVCTIDYSDALNRLFMNHI